MPESPATTASDGPLNEFQAAKLISQIGAQPPRREPEQPRGEDGKFLRERPEPVAQGTLSDDDLPSRGAERLRDDDTSARINGRFQEDQADGDPDGAPADLDIEIDATEEGHEPDEAETKSPSLEMPASWGKTAAELWAALPPEHQQFLHQHEAKRTAGISKQTQELQAVQDQVAEQAQAIEQERLNLANAALRYQADAVRQFQTEFADADPAQLAATDPLKFQRYQAGLIKMNQATQDAQAWQQAVNDHRMQQLAEFRKSENEKLIELMPELSDKAKAAAFEKRISEGLTPIGISQQRLAQYSAAEVALANDGLKWRAAVAKRKEVEAKQRAEAKPPRVIRPGTPGQTSALSGEARQNQLKQNLRKTGSVEAAAAVIKSGWQSQRR